MLKPLPRLILMIALVSVAGSDTAGAEPLDNLMEGNRRFTSGSPQHPRQDMTRRGEVAGNQKPFAVVVGCADSRVPPEQVFDQGIGDLFVVRVAGNVVDDIALGSIEFAVANLGAPLIIVLGHERCGAVAAALDGGTLPGHIAQVVGAISPHLRGATSQGGDRLNEAVRANVAAVTAQLRASEPVLAPRFKDGSLSIVGAVYDLDDGKVSLLDPAGGES